MKNKNSKGSKAKGRRYDRDAWLAEALEVLSQEGRAKLTVRNISERLGVTTGSFYWHFETREDFIHALIDYWKQVFTNAIASEVSLIDQSPQDQLYNLMKVLTEREIPRYNIAVRAWGAMDQEVSKTIREVDRTQIDFVSNLFKQIGFKGAELEMRTRTFVVFMSAELGWNYDLSKSERLKAMELRYKWFVAK